MKSPAHDLAIYLTGHGVGTFGALPGTISVGVEPADPIEVVTLYDTGGEPPDTVELDLLRPTFQVRTRTLTYAAGWIKQEQIRDLLILPGRIVTADSAFVEIDMVSDIAAIGRDENSRFLMTANYRAIRERS